MARPLAASGAFETLGLPRPDKARTSICRWLRVSELRATALCRPESSGIFGKERSRAWRRTRGQADGKTGHRTAVREFGRGRPPQGGVCVRSGFLRQSRPRRPPQSIRSQPSRQRSSVLPVAEVHLRMRESRFLDRPSSFWTKRRRKTLAATLLAFQLEISTASATKYALDEKRFLHPQLAESCGIEGMVTPIRGVQIYFCKNPISYPGFVCRLPPSGGIQAVVRAACSGRHAASKRPDIALKVRTFWPP